MGTLTGRNAGVVDGKGRIVVPSNLRARLGDRVVLAQGLEPCVQIHTLESWENFAATLAGLSRFDEEAAWLRRAFGDSAEERVIDDQGRVFLAEHLRGHASIEREVQVIGAIDVVEVWDPAVYAKLRAESVSVSNLRTAARRLEL